MSRYTVKLATAVALSAGLVLSATACSSSSGSSAAPSAKPINANLNQINAVDPSQLKQGGTFNFPVDQYSSQWNVLNADSQNEQSTVWTMESVMPQEFHTTADNKLVVDTDYFSSITNTMTGGKQVTTYDINPKAKWSDGTPITWKDIQADWQVQNGKNPKFNDTQTTGYSQIASVVQGKDQFEAVVTYATPFSDWAALFSPLYPASQISTVDGFNNSYKNKIPVTAGPFKIGKMDPTTKVVTVVRDPNWWGTKPVLDSINFRTLDASSTPGAFASGEIDWEDIGPSPSIYKQAKQVAGASIRVAGAPNLRQMWLNGKSPNLTDVNVRKAVMQAINRVAIGKSDLSGLPWDVQLLNNNFLVNNASGYKDNAGALGQFDPTAAKAALDAAGWKMGSNGFRSKDGKEFDLTLEIPAGTPVATNEAQLITAMLKDVGINVKTTQGVGDQFFNDVQAGKFDLTVFSELGSLPYFPISNVEPNFLNPTAAGIGSNYSRIGSPELDAAMNKAGSDTDPTQYLADVNAADALVWQMAIHVPLYQRPQIVATKSTLANFGANGFQDIDWTKIGFTK